MAKSIIKNAKIKGISVILGENKRRFGDEPLQVSHPNKI